MVDFWIDRFKTKFLVLNYNSLSLFQLPDILEDDKVSRNDF